MKTAPVIMQTAQPIDLPAPAVSADLTIGVLIAAGGWLGRQLWEHFTKKDQAEAALIRELIGGLQTNNQMLLQQIQAQSQAQLATQQEHTAAVRELREAVCELRAGMAEIRQQINKQ